TPRAALMLSQSPPPSNSPKTIGRLVRKRFAADGVELADTARPPETPADFRMNRCPRLQSRSLISKRSKPAAGPGRPQLLLTPTLPRSHTSKFVLPRQSPGDWAGAVRAGGRGRSATRTITPRFLVRPILVESSPGSSPSAAPRYSPRFSWGTPSCESRNATLSARRARNG